MKNKIYQQIKEGLSGASRAYMKQQRKANKYKKWLTSNDSQDTSDDGIEYIKTIEKAADLRKAIPKSRDRSKK